MRDPSRLLSACPIRPGLVRAGFTLVELLVVIAIVGMLVAMLLPAVQASREAARSVECRNNLKQVGLALVAFHDTQRSFPPARLAPRPGDPPELSCGNDEPSWLVRILPYLEQGNASEEWDVYESFAAHPLDVRSQPVAAYVCPARRSASEAVSPPTTYRYTAPCG